MADDYEYFRTVDGRIIKKKKKSAGADKKATGPVDKGKGGKKPEQGKKQNGIRGWLMRKSPKWRKLMEAIE